MNGSEILRVALGQEPIRPTGLNIVGNYAVNKDGCQGEVRRASLSAPSRFPLLRFSS